MMIFIKLKAVKLKSLLLTAIFRKKYGVVKENFPQNTFVYIVKSDIIAVTEPNGAMSSFYSFRSNITYVYDFKMTSNVPIA